jgi:tRNA/tmRNA/rRNA uracil-C5-methylase (TrmA/RlmC/RlmD family)
VPLLELTLGNPANGGGCVARDGSGRVVFVRHGLPGERVLARLTEEHPRWARADAVEILEPSPDRVTPPCVFSGPGNCGGCDYQHVSLEAQRELKRQLLKEQLRRVGKLDLDVMVESISGDNAGLGTRTRLRFGISASGTFAMRRHRSHELIEITTCLLGNDAIKNVMQEHEYFEGNDDLLIIALNGNDVALTRRVHFVTENDALDDPFDDQIDDDDDVEEMEETQHTSVDGVDFDVSPTTFWQSHIQAPSLLVERVLAALSLSPGDRVLDLYCGAGLFTKFIAHAVGPEGFVLGIEGSTTATRDAEKNLTAFPWAVIQESSVSTSVLARASEGFTHAVLDPPRSGVDAGALRTLSAMNTLTTIVSVSCDPATFARDLRILVNEGWEISTLRAFDLFPMTEHIECLAVLLRDGE